MSDPLPAARMKDPIQHTAVLAMELFGITGGVVAAGLVAGAIVFFTGGLGTGPAIELFCGGVSAGSAVGKWAAKWVPPSDTGEIAGGARSVYITVRPAACVTHKLECGDVPITKDAWQFAGFTLLGPLGGLAGLIYGTVTGKHGGAEVSQGSLTVFIERRGAARKTDGTSCGGEIADGCRTVLVGGPRGGVRGKEAPKWLGVVVDIVDLVGDALGFATGRGWDRFLSAVGLAALVVKVRAGQILGEESPVTEGAEDFDDAYDAASFLWDIGQELYKLKP